ncbi:MAG: response regulator [Spirochaetaceae bacterium]|nr:response regulator [Spirochaetaceae bacterium]
MRLLLVEDEKELSRAIKSMLVLSGYEVIQAFDGEEALALIENNFYDGIISDIMMPKMDGITLLKTIRKKNIDTPVLLLTANGQVEDKVEGLDAGANDYLSKPFAFKELLARVRSMIKHYSPIGENTHISYGSIKLSIATYELAGKESSIMLSNKEGKILSLFLKNPTQIIPFEKLVSFMSCLDAKDKEIELYTSILNNKLDAVNANFKLAKLNKGYKVASL